MSSGNPVGHSVVIASPRFVASEFHEGSKFHESVGFQKSFHPILRHFQLHYSNLPSIPIVTMVRRQKDVFDTLCGSMEFLMCGTEDFSKYSSKGKEASTKSAPAAEKAESPQKSNAQGSTSSPAKRPAKKVAIMAPVGEVIGVEKDPVSVSIRVESPGYPVYLELVSYYEKPGVYIKSIKPESKFHGTKIVEGMKIVRVNGTKCPESVQETFTLMKTAKEVITVTAVVVESEYAEDDFMFREIKLDDSLPEYTKEDKKEENSPSPTRVTTNWFGGMLGKKHEEEKKADDRSERKKITTERDRIGLGFADQVLKDLGVIDQDGEDNDSLYTYDQDDTTLRSAPTIDDTTYRSAPQDDDDFTLSTAGGATIFDSTPIIAKIFKKTKQDPLGLHFVSFKKKRGIFVYRIHEESRFLNTKLEPGMKLLAINGQPCPASVAETLAMVQNIVGDLSIKAHYPPTELNHPESPKRKPEDLTGFQVPAVFENAREPEEKEEDAKGTEQNEVDDKSTGGDTNLIVASLEDFTQSVENAVDRGNTKESAEKVE